MLPAQAIVILLNEVAPRPHNSGHHSIESCFTIQYEQHLWAVVGLPLGDPSMKTPAAMMYNILVSAGPPTTQTQKPSIHLTSGMPMQVPFHQPQLPVQFGGPNSQLQSQGMVNTSLPMPLPMRNPSQVQQQVFVQGLQPHLMQAQGIMYQGHSMNFSSQMGTHLGFFAHA